MWSYVHLVYSGYKRFSLCVYVCVFMCDCSFEHVGTCVRVCMIDSTCVCVHSHHGILRCNIFSPLMRSNLFISRLSGWVRLSCLNNEPSIHLLLVLSGFKNLRKKSLTSILFFEIFFWCTSILIAVLCFLFRNDARTIFARKENRGASKPVLKRHGFGGRCLSPGIRECAVNVSSRRHHQRAV
jgi:hypothetical protein